MIDPITLLVGGGIAGGLVSRVSSVPGQLAEWAKRGAVFHVRLSGTPYTAVSVAILGIMADTAIALGTPSTDIEMPRPQGNYDDPDDNLDDTMSARLAVGERFAKINGMRVLVNVTREKLNYGYVEELELTVAKKHREKLMAFIGSCIEEARNKSIKGLHIYTGATYGWTLANVRPFRPLKSVIHEGDAPSKIVEAIIEWRKTEADVIERGDNFHIGFLLSGPPGTGKTSTAIAVASDLRLPLYVVTPSSADNLEDAMRSIGKGILLIEEVDEIIRERLGGDTHDEVARGNKKVAGILSTLDGPTSKHGLIRIYTTNHPERLDPSFMREGRCDYHFKYTQRIAKDRTEAV